MSRKQKGLPEGMSAEEYAALFHEKGVKYAEEVAPLVMLIINAVSEYGAQKVRKEIYEQVDHAG